jgi:ATP-dependent RNA helicase DeaD
VFFALEAGSPTSIRLVGILLPLSFSLSPVTEEGTPLTQSFSDYALRPASREALVAMGVTTPTPIQAATLEPLLAGRDVIGQARTGSGKTLAFALPLLERVQRDRPGVHALVLVPTRELAVQVAGVIQALAGPSGPRVALVYGGRPHAGQAAALKNGAKIVVGTPGRTLDHLRQRTLSLREVRYLVLDEADEMLDRGFAPDVEQILSHAPRERQTALFSATVADWVHAIAARHLRDPLTVRVDPSPEQAAPSVEQLVFEVPDGQKQAVLETLLDRRGDGSVVVFGRTKHGVKKLGTKLAAKGFPVVTLQGNLSQNARDRAMEAFRAGKAPILVATNVAARGIDVSSIEQVINYELPESAELFLHRTGRTGRMGRQGEAITLLSPSEAEQWRKLERDLGRKLPRQRWDGPLPNAPDRSELEQPRRAGPYRRPDSRLAAPSPRPRVHAAQRPPAQAGSGVRASRALGAAPRPWRGDGPSRTAAPQQARPAETQPAAAAHRTGRPAASSQPARQRFGASRKPTWAAARARNRSGRR